MSIPAIGWDCMRGANIALAGARCDRIGPLDHGPFLDPLELGLDCRETG